MNFHTYQTTVYVCLCVLTLTLWVSYLNLGCWATEGHSDFLEAGVKGHLPSVADPTEVISRQQVDFG